MTSIRQKLAELRNIAREGGTVDLAEFVSLEQQEAAQDRIAALGAEGEAARAAEKAERERLARRAQAATEARDMVAGSRDRIVKTYGKLAALLAELDEACDDYQADINSACATLSNAGYATWNQTAYAPQPVDHPDFDEHMHSIIASGGHAVQIDDTRHSPVNAGRIALWAAANHAPGVSAGLGAWKQDRNTYPLTAPLPEIAE